MTPIASAPTLKKSQSLAEDEFLKAFVNRKGPEQSEVVKVSAYSFNCSGTPPDGLTNQDLNVAKTRVVDVVTLTQVPKATFVSV